MGQPTPSTGAEAATAVAPSTPPAVAGTPATTPAVTTAPAEKLYAGKYKTPEELESAYKEAERTITDRGRKANLIDNLTVRIAQEQGVSEEIAFDYLASLSQGELKELGKQMGAPQTGAGTGGVEPSPGSGPAAPGTPNPAPNGQYSDPIARAEARRARWDYLSDRLVAAHPEAASVLDQIELEFMQKGENPVTIFEKRYLPLIQRGQEAAAASTAGKNAAAPTVGAGVIPAPDPLEEAFYEAQRTGSWVKYYRLKREAAAGKK